MTSEISPIPKQRRRRYDAAFKQAIVEQTLVPGASVARIAREHGINANQLFKWRRQFLVARDGQPSSGQPSAVSLLPVALVADEPASDTVPSPANTAASGQLEIQLSGGTVRIRGAVDTAMLQLVLSSLRR